MHPTPTLVLNFPKAMGIYICMYIYIYIYIYILYIHIYIFIFIKRYKKNNIIDSLEVILIILNTDNR